MIVNPFTPDIVKEICNNMNIINREKVFDLFFKNKNYFSISNTDICFLTYLQNPFIENSIKYEYFNTPYFKIIKNKLKTNNGIDYHEIDINDTEILYLACILI